VAMSLVKELGGIPGIADLEPTITERPTHIHLLGYATPFDERKVSQDSIITELRRRLSAHPSYKPSITVRNPLGGGEQGGFPISANLLGPDMDRLADYGMRALAMAQKLPSLTQPKITLNVSNPEIHVQVDRKRAADLGVRMATIGNTLRLAVAGDDEISNYREGSEQYPVKIRVLENQRRDIDAIGKLTVPSATGGAVRIDNLARLDRGLGPSTLQRYNRQFSVSLVSDLAPGHALDEASNDVRKMLADLNLPPDMSYKLSGQTKILDETTQNLLMAIALAMIFVYMVLAAQFESFIQPIVIMLVLPLSIPFALFTIWITGRTLNLWSALGVLLLLGIVKKNSILQVDYANVLRAKGMPIREAIVESCRTRLRPILMTTSAIIAGLIPTSLGLGIGGQGRAAIAITVIGGQSLCLFLTLLLVPVAYIKFDAFEQSLMNQKWKEWIGRMKGGFGRFKPATEKAG
jgi:hydrophobic/amphiphilic exporter-1 (mainly G- bacteria), HAE1 family